MIVNPCLRRIHLALGVVFAANAAMLSLPQVTQNAPLTSVTAPALFKSEDSGGTWTKIPEPPRVDTRVRPPQKSLGSRISGLVLDPGNTSTIYANVVLRTIQTGGGGYITQSQGVIFRTTNGGKKWEESIPLSPRTYTALVVDPAEPSRLYAATGNGVLKSTNSGRDWSSIFSLGSVRGLALEPSDRNVLYALNVRSILKTPDAGKTWTGMTPADTSALTALVIDPRDTRTIFVGTDRGVLRSMDGGQSWSGSSTSLGRVALNAIAIDPSDPSVVFAATEVGGNAAVYKSTDRGVSWTLSTQFVGFVPRGIAIAGTAPAPVFVWGENSTGFRSVDGGTTWQTILPDHPGSSVSALAIDPRTPRIVYIATSSVQP